MDNNIDISENNSEASKEIDVSNTNIETLTAEISEVTSSKCYMRKTVDNISIR